MHLHSKKEKCFQKPIIIFFKQEQEDEEKKEGEGQKGY